MQSASLHSGSPFREPEVDADLCTRCESLHIPQLFEGPRIGEKFDGLYPDTKQNLVLVGPFSTLLDDSSCSLCDILRKVHSRHHTHCDGSGEVCFLLPVRADLTPPLDVWRHRVVLGRFQHLGTESETLATDVYLIFLSTTVSNDDGIDRYETWALQGLDLHWRFKLESRYAVPCRPLLNHFSLPKSRLAFDAIRVWLNDCETKHDECRWGVLAEAQLSLFMRNDDDGVPEAHPIRCIDIISRRLVAMSPRARYVCLSYVWGEVNLAAQRCSFVEEDDKSQCGETASDHSRCYHDRAQPRDLSLD